MSWVEVEMNWVEVDGAGWKWVHGLVIPEKNKEILIKNNHSDCLKATLQERSNKSV